MSEQQETRQLSNRWQERFAFYDAYGLPNSSPAGRAAFKALSFGQRFALNSNFLAFLFGPFYFLVKGMWRKGLTLLGVSLAIGAVTVVLNLPDRLSTGIGFAIGALAMTTANYAYYLHVVKGSQSWNLFEGFGRASR
ncbi:DUF2628 domain-containing protein [Nocardia sp. NPDC059240]|uniref:DUF2628 domain-containing protein n=1 Tax=Nocardia sp. NPDC059240 TaxID=3346786 RepID=UPI0036B6EF8C